MNYNIKIGDQTFEVEVEDINKRPVIARVDGQEFEVTIGAEAGQISAAPAAGPRPPANRSGINLTGNLIVSPLPGTVIEVFIKPGETVEAGQVVLIIEAMKMKNSIRSTRDGIVAAVCVSAGQTVTHKQTLVEFTE